MQNVVIDGGGEAWERTHSLRDGRTWSAHPAFGFTELLTSGCPRQQRVTRVFSSPRTSGRNPNRDFARSPTEPEVESGARLYGPPATISLYSPPSVWIFFRSF